MSEPAEQPAPAPLTERAGRWNDAGGLPTIRRPRAPRLTGPQHPGGRANHRSLVAIHDHLRHELTEIRQAAQQVVDQQLPPELARDMINRMTLRQNHWTLGSFCAAYCRVLTLHHSIEDAHMFPAVAAVDPGLQPVVDRLHAEHVVIHDVLERFDEALVLLVVDRSGDGLPDESGSIAVRTLVGELSDLLLSHLAYEEDELAEGLSRMPGMI